MHLLSEIAAEELWLKKINEYFESGNDLLVTDSRNGWTLLHYASENLFYSVVSMLLKYGVPVDIRASDATTSYLIALDASIDTSIQYDEPYIDFSIVKLLLSHGADEKACSMDGISKESLLQGYGSFALQSYKREVDEEIAVLAKATPFTGTT